MNPRRFTNDEVLRIVNGLTPLMMVALQSIVIEYAVTARESILQDGPLRWVDIRTDEEITIDDVLTFVGNV
jgi:hypothetical protein